MRLEIIIDEDLILLNEALKDNEVMSHFSLSFIPSGYISDNTGVQIQAW